MIHYIFTLVSNNIHTRHTLTYTKITYTRLACKIQCERTVYLTALAEEKRYIKKLSLYK